MNNIAPDNITDLKENEVFVFGSNKKGCYDGGAARFALNNFGAIYGRGEGIQGKSYAINSMDGIEAMKPEIAAFITWAKEKSNTTFLVTEIGCGIAGYTPEEIAPLFKDCLTTPNIHLPQRFWNIIKP